ncbi:MAG TPA: hypothetical protein VLE91_02555 [Candidatus Saccharimonadales bacterium]|nr:hypothetical protein [Candidatus Saccharimonadales bacterium]
MSRELSIFRGDCDIAPALTQALNLFGKTMGIVGLDPTVGAELVREKLGDETVEAEALKKVIFGVQSLHTHLSTREQIAKSSGLLIEVFGLDMEAKQLGDVK